MNNKYFTLDLRFDYDELMELSDANYWYTFTAISEHWNINGDDDFHIIFECNLAKDDTDSLYVVYGMRINLRYAVSLMGLNMKQAYDNYCIITDQLGSKRLYKCKNCKLFFDRPEICSETELGHCGRRFCTSCLHLHFRQLTCDHDDAVITKTENNNYIWKNCNDCKDKILEKKEE